jgi:hypothetical protein
MDIKAFGTDQQRLSIHQRVQNTKRYPNYTKPYSDVKNRNKTAGIKGREIISLPTKPNQKFD